MRKPGTKIGLFEYDGRGEVCPAPLGVSRRAAPRRSLFSRLTDALILNHPLAVLQIEAASPSRVQRDFNFYFPAQHAFHSTWDPVQHHHQLIAWHLFGSVIVDVVMFSLNLAPRGANWRYMNTRAMVITAIAAVHALRRAVDHIITNESAQLDACMHVQAPAADVNVLWGWASLACCRLIEWQPGVQPHAI